MYGLAVNLIISLSEHLSNIDEINPCLGNIGLAGYL